jgi:hypothetical protein
MTDIDRTLTAFFVDDSAHRVAPHLDEVLAVTQRTRQRPWWSSPKRWLPVDLTIERRLVPASRWRPIAVVLALLLLLAVVLGVAGMRRSAPGPFVGLARNGLIAFIDWPNLKVANADGTHVRVFRSGLPDPTTSLAFSPDGTRLSYRTLGGDGAIHIVRPDGSGEVTIPAPLREPQPGDVAWSFDAASVAYLREVDGVTRIFVAPADGSTDGKLLFATSKPDEQPSALGWSPDGTLISFFSMRPTGSGLFLAHPDGSGVHRLQVEDVDPEMGPISWAPDAVHQRIALVVGDNSVTPAAVKMYDVATDKASWLGPGFWPTWSPDGTSIACWCRYGGATSTTVASILAGAPDLKALQPVPTENADSCQTETSVSGRALCSPAHWSPDAHWAAGPDVLMHDLVLVSADPTGSPVIIHLDNEADPSLQIAWQPLRG